MDYEEVTTPATKAVTDTAPQMRARLVALQYHLLAAGYRYVDGDVQAWPLTDVILTQGGRTLFLAPWYAARQHSLRRFWYEMTARDARIGLLLVGTDPLDTPAVRDFFAAAPGTVAYLDAGSGQFRLQENEETRLAAPEVLDRDAFAGMLAAPPPPPTAEADCLAALRDAIPPITEPVDDAPAAPIITRPAFPLCAYTLISLCVLAFIGQLLTGGLDALLSGTSPLLVWGVLYGPYVRAGEWWRLLTSALLHGGIIHLGMNMMALYYLGPTLEGWQGRWRLLAVFVFSVLAGSLASLWWSPNSPSVGASGGIFGLLGFIAALLARDWRQYPRAMRSGLFNWLRSVLVINLIISFLPGINGAAHIGGLLGGFVLGLLIGRPPHRDAATPLSTGVVLAIIVLLAVTAHFGMYAIGRIPLP